MVKKGIKRKTRWRTLSIGDGATDTDTGTTELKQDQNECLTTTSNTNLSSTYSRKPSSFTTPFHQRNGDRNHYFKNSDKYPSHSYTRNQSQDENLHQETPTSYSYKRRPFYQSPSSRYYGNTNKPSPTSINRSFKSTDTFDNKENNATKPLFNEDEYTRITTPRQDVLFKKGYLSRPKKTITPIDSAASSSTAVSVVSTEESISSSTQSTSPEHCSSTPEIFDPDHPLMYTGFYDQNGVFFVNPFMTNGFDPYGQMLMMPYGGSPYSINPSEYCNNELTSPYPPNHYQKRNSIDSENSPESPSSQNESTSTSSTPAIDERVDESSNEPSQNGDIPAESQSESDGPKPDEEITPNECNHNLAMQYYYPYMYGPPPFYPINEAYYNQSMAQYINDYGVKYNRFKKRKRRPFKSGNSTGVSNTTTDYSEDEDSIEENNRLLDHALQQNGIDLMPCLTMSQCDDVISRTTLNTNVSEFVPRHLQATALATTLNVEVEEFHPRNTASSIASPSTDDSPVEIVDSSSKEPNPKSIAVLDSPKSELLQPTPNDKSSKITNPVKANTDKPGKKHIQVSSAISKSSTLISSISTRDKNDDNVNGVDKIKKIEKLVDQVNVKADLDDKVVMHPKQNENILENVKKTKLKNMKTGKSIPRKSNNGQKKEINNGKMAKITNGVGKIDINRSVGESVQVIAKDKLEEVTQLTDVEKQGNVGVAKLVKRNQPTYAQMVGPIAKPVVEGARPATSNIIQENNHELSTEELKMLEVFNNDQPEVKIAPKWQTVLSKGKKKYQVVCDEQNDKWEDLLEDKPDEIIEIVPPKIDDIKIDEPIQNGISDKSVEMPTPPAKAKPTKTEKAKLKTKIKKNQKKLKENNLKCSGIDEARIEDNKPNGISTPTKREKSKSLSIDPDIDDLLDDEGNEFLNNVDISNFNFETSPSMFVNAITNSGIYTDNAMIGKTNTGFAMNNSLKLLNKFDFCKMKENILLKEEEEMVIRVLKSLNQTDDRIVNVNKDQYVDPHSIKIIEEVAVNQTCENVKIEENIFENVNGDNSHTMIPVDHETDGAENIVECKADDEVNGMDREMNGKNPLPTNGYIEDHNSKVDKSDCCDIEPKAYCVEPTNIFESEVKGQLIEEYELKINSNGFHNEDTDSNCMIAQKNSVEAESMESTQRSNSFEDNKNDLDNMNVANNAETERDEVVNLTIQEQTHKDCTPNFKYDDDETQSELSELSDENEETIVSQSNFILDNDESETIKDIDAIEEPIDDLQFDDEFVMPSNVVCEEDEEINMKPKEFSQNGCKPLDLTMQTIQEISLENEISSRPAVINIFIENETNILKEEITLNENQENKDQDRIQSPRNSEDSGILEQDDGRFFSELDIEKPDLFSMQKFPLTEAISRWLEEKQKEKSPEPILRLPDDPELSQRIENSMKSRLHLSEFIDDDNDEDDDDLSSESETEFEVAQHSKNLIGNPLRVLFRKKDGPTTINQFIHSDNVKHDDKTNEIKTRKRVAHHNLDSDKASLTVDEPDILEFWENDPMLQSRNSNSHVLKPVQNCSIESDLEAYESVYGKTIDYAKLTADVHNDNVFLSNNILNNDNLNKLPINPNNNNNDSSVLNHANSINPKDDTNSNNTNLNCFKPPEICCMLM